MTKFTCECCGNEADNEVDDAEALAEFKAVFGEAAANENTVAVCGPCYEVLTSDNPLEHVRKLASEITGQDLN